jgi:DNA-binding NarL/FixJ family response regulator
MTGMRGNRIRVLLVSLPGMMQNVLRDTFTRRADVNVVGVASGGLSAVSMIQKMQPELVVIDSSLPDAEMSELIHWLKKGNQHIRSLALVETTQQLTTAASTGADLTIRSYTLPDNLDIVLGNMRLNQDNQ